MFECPEYATSPEIVHLSCEKTMLAVNKATANAKAKTILFITASFLGQDFDGNLTYNTEY
jgi:hypothetical protein